MKTKLVTAVIMAFFSANLLASNVDHFKGMPSPDLQSALCNLQKFDTQLKSITSKPLTANDMAEIHQLTYTLEVALQKVQQELTVAAEELEKVHKGSETMAKEKVKKSAIEYLARTAKLTKAPSCQ